MALAQQDGIMTGMHKQTCNDSQTTGLGCPRTCSFRSAGVFSGQVIRHRHTLQVACRMMPALQPAQNAAGSPVLPKAPQVAKLRRRTVTRGTDRHAHRLHLQTTARSTNVPRGPHMAVLKTAAFAWVIPRCGA